jgi:hypothetical protein
MNKKLLLILLVGLILVAGFTFVYAKHINKEAKPFKAPAFRGDTRVVEEPTVPVVERIRTGMIYEKPKSLNDLKTALTNTGKVYVAPENQIKTESDIEAIKIATPAGILDEWSLTECMLYVHEQPCCYAQPWPSYYDAYMNCVGTAEYWEYQDPNFRNDWNECGYPIYPFQPTSVGFHVITPGPCSLDCEFALAWDFGSIYWGFPFPYYPAPDWSSGPVTIYLNEAGDWWVSATITDGPCYHVPYFARFWLLNSDDFTEGPDAHRCGPDTVWGHYECVEPVIPDEDSCVVDTTAEGDTIWGHWECVEPVIPDEDSCIVYLPARYGFWISGVFDQSSVRNKGYYYNDLIGGYYDIVDIKGGSMRVRTTGFTRDQNECELESLWYHKASFGEWECSLPIEEHLELCIIDIDTTVTPPETTWGSYRLVTPVNYGYAPDGIPDFPQVEPHFCGPATLTNCLWWCFAGGFPWYVITNWYGAWDPSIPPVMMNDLAICMNTTSTGTNVYDMQQCIRDLNETFGFWLSETTIVQPTFEDIEYQVRLSQDVILLLGFWYYDETAGEWYRLGGHYVNVEGVNLEYFLFSFSDPAIDGFCSGMTPGDSSGGVFLAHDHAVGCHFDAGNVSHDYYQIAFDSPSPGGVIWIPYYEWYNPAFYKMNFTPELEPFMAPTGEPQYLIHTEIEYAVVICPGRPFLTDNKDSWNMWMQTSNYGEEGLEVATWQYYPELTNDGFEGSIILGTYPDDIALSVTAVGEDIKFFPTTPLNVTYYYYDDSDSIVVEQLDAEYYHNHPTHPLPVEIDYMGIGLDPAAGVLAGHPLGDMVIQKFVLHATDIIVDTLEWAIFFDLDVNYANYVSENPSFGGGDSLTNTMWAYDTTRPDKTVYITLAPTAVGKVARNAQIFDQNNDIYEHVPCGPYDSLKVRMEMDYWQFPDVAAENHEWYDYAYLMTSEHFMLDSCERILQEYLIWYDWQTPDMDYDAYRCKLYRLLRGAGFYRGDVGNFDNGAASPGVLDIADIVYLIAYILRAGPAPDPFIDQGDVDCDGETKIEDVVYLVRYILRSSGVPPIDKDRFYNEHSPWPEYQMMFSRPSLFADPQWQNLGAGCYP